VDNTDVLAVAMKSRSFSSFSCSANELMCRSWEGAQPGIWPKLASGNIPYHGHHAQLTARSSPGGRRLFLFFSELESSCVWEFKLFQELRLFWEFFEICESGFCDCCSGTGCLSVVGR